MIDHGAVYGYSSALRSQVWSYVAWVQASPQNELAFCTHLAVGLAVAFSFVFVLMMSGVKAEYGRYTIGSTGWAYQLRMPGKLAWVLQESPTVIIAFLCWRLATPAVQASLANRVLLGLFCLHYGHRTFVFPLMLRGGKPTPVVLMLNALVFCTLNGYMQARSLCLTLYPAGWLERPQTLVGIALFFTGMLCNLHADYTLIGLRKPGQTGYSIPRGGMFEYVSGANFFGEIIEWTGFALACGSVPAAAFAFTTACNIGPRAIQHHQWYLSKFDDYPPQRKALIPFLV